MLFLRAENKLRSMDGKKNAGFYLFVTAFLGATAVLGALSLFSL